MSSVESINGLSDKEHLYQSYKPEITPETEKYIPTPEELEKNSGNPLSERIQLLHPLDNRFSVYKIDRCIRAKTVSDSFRESLTQYWENAHTHFQVRAWTNIVFMGGASVAAFVYTPWIMIASVAGAAFAAYNFIQSSNAKEQIAGWKQSPAEAIAIKRRQAYEQGFGYAYQKNLKLSGPSSFAVLLPVEMQHLHGRYWGHFCRELLGQTCNTSKQKKAWLDQFRTINPVSEPVLQYVYGEVPSFLKDLSQNVNRVSDSLKTIELDFNRIRDQRKQETQSTKDSIENKRMLARVAPDLTLRLLVNRLENEKQRKIREWTDREGSNIQEKNAMEEDHQLKIAALQAGHATIISSINSYFDSKSKEADEALQTILKEIKQHEAHAFSPYYEYCKGLVANAMGAKEGRLLNPQPAFNPSQVLNIPQLPKIEINFQLQLPGGVNQEFAEALQQKAPSFQMRYS